MLRAAFMKEHTMRAMTARGLGLTRVARVLLVTATVLLAACGHKSASTTVGVGIGVTLSSPTATTIVEIGSTLEIDAVVSGDPANKGVTWSLFGAGSASSSTDLKYVYKAPAAAAGADTVTLTATSISDPTQVASVTITVNGTMLLQPPVLFPANINIPYAAFITVDGGVAPYTWIVQSGSLPPGLALDGSTSQTTAISGTPTTLGTYTFVIKVTDSAAGTQSKSLTLAIYPQSACVLSGQYTYLFTGFRNGLDVVRAGTLLVATDGTLTGEHDYKDNNTARIDEQVSDGTCTTVTQNRGNVQVVSPSTVEQFDFGVGASLSFGQIQEDDGTPVVGSGTLIKQDTTAFNLAALAGDFALGLVGDDGKKDRLVVVGRLTLGATGTVSAGQADSSSALVPAESAITGIFTSPDSFGRGTAHLLVGGLTLPVAYYVVDANTLYIVSNDSATTTPRIAGRMTRQTGAGTFSDSAFSGETVISLFGSQFIAGLPAATVGVGYMKGGSGGTIPTELDVVVSGGTVATETASAAPYTVSANGRGTLSVGAAGDITHHYVLYLSAPGTGYLFEPGSAVGMFGVLDAQTGGPYTTFVPTYFVGGSVFSCSSSPITLTPQLFFDEGAMSGNVTGEYALDPLTGRIIASVQRNILGGSELVGFLISPQRMVLLGNGVNSVNSTVVWLTSYSAP